MIDNIHDRTAIIISAHTKNSKGESLTYVERNEYIRFKFALTRDFDLRTDNNWTIETAIEILREFKHRRGSSLDDMLSCVQSVIGSSDDRIALAKWLSLNWTHVNAVDRQIKTGHHASVLDAIYHAKLELSKIIARKSYNLVAGR
jgi:hypothetical protein